MSLKHRLNRIEQHIDRVSPGAIDDRQALPTVTQADIDGMLDRFGEWVDTLPDDIYTALSAYMEFFHEQCEADPTFSPLGLTWDDPRRDVRNTVLTDGLFTALQAASGEGVVYADYLLGPHIPLWQLLGKGKE
jgi:hypothetical protein